MKDGFLMCMLLVYACSVSAQQVDSSIWQKQEVRINMLEQRCRDLQQRNEALSLEVLSLKQSNLDIATREEANKRNISLLADSLNVKLKETHATIDENVTEVKEGVKNRSVWGIVIAVILALLTAGVFLLLRKLIAKKGDDIELLRARADDLNRQMVEKMAKEADTILKELESLAHTTNVELGWIQQISINILNTPTDDNGKTSEPDHSLVKALADRITFMEMTLYRMDSSIKGHKHLSRSIKQMKDNLLANGYELVDMLGKDYVEGMKASPSFNDDDTLERGKRIITGITKPQINYRGQMIQAAQITVSQNI